MPLPEWWAKRYAPARPKDPLRKDPDYSKLPPLYQTPGYAPPAPGDTPTPYEPPAPGGGKLPPVQAPKPKPPPQRRGDPALPRPTPIQTMYKQYRSANGKAWVGSWRGRT